MPTQRHNEPWKGWYDLPRWHRLRTWQLRQKPWCEFCERRGITSPATVVDHRVPHRGDQALFWLGQLQSLCKSCHDGEKRVIEIKGFSDRIGADGLPLDPMHPFNTGKIDRKKFSNL
jgi:5-methylcytosine-specific restriction enzyme A